VTNSLFNDRHKKQSKKNAAGISAWRQAQAESIGRIAPAAVCSESMLKVVAYVVLPSFVNSEVVVSCAPDHVSYPVSDFVAGTTAAHSDVECKHCSLMLH
jgi:hypothetical protein